MAADDHARKMAMYAQFARVGKALANPARLELLDLLAQGERSVEDLVERDGVLHGAEQRPLLQRRVEGHVRPGQGRVDGATAFVLPLRRHQHPPSVR